MDLIYVLDYRFARTPDGDIWTDTSYDAAFWDPYLRVFDQVVLISRVREVAAAGQTWRRVNSSLVSVLPLPHYLGPTQFIRQSAQIRRLMRKYLQRPGAVMLRVPSQLSNCAAARLQKMQRPYSVEVVGDASASLAPGVIRARGRSFFRWWFTRCQKQQCANAVGASYVARILNERYPARTGATVLICSDVRLEVNWIRHNVRSFAPPGATKLVTVATLSQTYKGLEVLLDAVAKCHRQGLPLTLTLIGDGKYRGELEAQAKQLNIANYVRFTGALAWGSELITELDRADLFVLPSRVEALPRALLEAMARALPCIATRVGAVPDLLDAQSIVTAGDSEELAKRISSVAADPLHLTEMSSQNLAIARQYASDLLRPRWNAFYRECADRTALIAWSQKQNPTAPAAVTLATHTGRING